MIRKQRSLIAEIEKVLVVWREDQTSHNIEPKPNAEQGSNSSVLWRLRLVQKLLKKSLKLREVGSYGLWKEVISITEKEGKAANADIF